MQAPTSILTPPSSSSPFYRWFQGGELNTCYNCIDRHVQHDGRGDEIAVIYDSPVTNTVKRYSYSELFNMVNEFSSLLQSLGVKKGDRVLIYLPNTPEALVAMLSCARLGAIHSVVFGGFAPTELAVRILDCQPKVILSASCGVDGKKLIPYKEYLDEAIDIANNNSNNSNNSNSNNSTSSKVEKCIVFHRKNLDYVPSMKAGRDIDWYDSLKNHKNKRVDCAVMKSEDPLYVLYTSGTTGKPKGVVRDNGGHAVALQWAMEHVFNMKQGNVFWASSDIGWVVGHSFIVYGPLLRGCTTVLYEGKPVDTPDHVNFWRTVERHQVNCLFSAPTAIRAIKKNDPKGELTKNFNLSSLQALFLAGEHADTNTIHWAEKALNCPVLDNWWQTETGWPICANQIGVHGFLKMKAGSCFKRCPGYDLQVSGCYLYCLFYLFIYLFVCLFIVIYSYIFTISTLISYYSSFPIINTQVLDSNNNPVPPNTMGNLAIKLPLPPGTLLSIWGNDQRFIDSYLSKIPGYYDTGDAGYIDEDEYVYVMTRTDDVINVAGHRLSTGQMEEVSELL